jgi:hypothetical protein
MERKYPTGHPTSQRSATVDGHINGAMIKTYRRKMKKAGNLVAIQQLNKWLGHRDPILEQISVGGTQKERDVQHDETQTKRRAAATEREQEEDRVRLQKMKDILTKTSTPAPVAAPPTANPQPEPSAPAPRECFHMWVPTKPPPDLVQARAKAFSIPKKPPPPKYDTTASEESEEEGVEEKTDEQHEKAIDDPVSDESSSHNGTSTTPTHHIPHIEAWLIHANLERLAHALASNFRVHPNVAGDYSPGSKDDKILSSRNGGKPIKDAIMRRWQLTNP